MKNQNQNENTNNNNQTNETNHDAGQIGCKPRLLLPQMKTAENALELCSLEQDHFYLSAFTIQIWLGRVIASITAEYAQKKDPRTRALQSGQTWRIFLETTAHAFVREDAHRPKYGTPIKPESLDQTDLCSFISDIVRLLDENRRNVVFALLKQGIIMERRMEPKRPPEGIERRKIIVSPKATLRTP